MHATALSQRHAWCWGASAALAPLAPQLPAGLPLPATQGHHPGGGAGCLPSTPGSLSHLRSCGEAALPQGGTPRAAIHLSLNIVLAPLQRQYNLNTEETKIISSLI